ncbi:hypothetical protein Francci3_4072 [Frankia casuarinae]|uniref:Uncharacterized protein n=1 Tax=Frankia casuarinae (strain DSM 45818 / CECT 9043 / HFP020203 / CcI3) TaxID=106370 RepID=Q2J5M2_FRACC|nr:hypothetical protein Francci3_4072 [Frankia casuarinae]
MFRTVSSDHPSVGLLLTPAERLALLLLLAAQPRGETLPSDSSTLNTRAYSRKLQESVLDVPLAVVRLVRDPLDEVVDARRRVKVRRAHLTELVKDTVTNLPPVLPQLLFHLLHLLLLSHFPSFSSRAEHPDACRPAPAGTGGTLPQPSRATSNPRTDMNVSSCIRRPAPASRIQSTSLRAG